LGYFSVQWYALDYVIHLDLPVMALCTDRFPDGFISSAHSGDAFFPM